MDVLPLNKKTYYPIRLFEGYTSLIWTERYNGYGEFRLVSSRIQETIKTFPLGSLVTLRDTTEIMMVETHSIEPNNSDGTPEITISGRSLDSFLENRVLTPTRYNESWDLLQIYTPQEMLCLLIWNAIVNNTGVDPTKTPSDDTIPSNPRLVVPKVVVSLSDIYDDPAALRWEWSLSGGVVSEQVQNIQTAYNIGVRTIRPTLEPDPYVNVSFDTGSNVGQRGVPIFDLVEQDTTHLRFDVYKGTDRTIYQSQVTPVIFHQLSSHIADPKHLQSIKNYKNDALVVGSANITSFSNIEDIESWYVDVDYQFNDKVKYEDQIWIATADPAIGERPGTSTEASTLSYLGYLQSETLDANPLVLYSFDSAPSAYSDPVTDLSGNNYHGTWYVDNDPISENVVQYPAIFGNGNGSTRTASTWVTVNHNLPEHASWTISFLVKGVDGAAWRSVDFCGRPWSPYSEPWWTVGTDSNGYLFAEYVTSWSVRQTVKSNVAFTSGSSHVITVSYDAPTYTLSIYSDKVLRGSAVITGHPPAATPSQKLQIATSTQYQSTSHWAYWSSALSSDQILGAHQVALDGGLTIPGVTNSWSVFEEQEDPDDPDANQGIDFSSLLNASGLERRVLYVDGGDKDLIGLRNQAEIELLQNKLISMADGEISPLSPYKYGRDYFLGDTITFAGNYESNTSMFINEIVRTEDQNGETISPGIINLNESGLNSNDTDDSGTGTIIT